jgi:hypothetical protein
MLGFHLTPVRWLPSRTQTTTNVGEDMEKRTLIHCWWKCKLVKPLWKTVWRLHKTLKLELPYDPAIPFLGIYLKEHKSGYNKGTYAPMFIAALVTIVKMWKQPKCPLLMNKLRKCSIYIQWNFIQPQRRMKFCCLEVNGWNWRT